MGIEIRRDVVKKKDKRLPDRVGMIVSGPPELFSNDVMDRLALAGFRKTKPRNESYKEVWRLTATVGATPDHLLRTLSSVAHVSGDPAVERAVDMGTRPSSGTGAGAADLSVKVLGPFFCANCEFDNKPRRAFLEGAGFFPLFQPGVPGKDIIIKAFGDFPYVSQDGIIAANLLPWMDAAAKTALLDRMKEEKMRIARSGVKQRIKGDPVIPMPEGEALQGFQDAGVNNLLRTRKSGVIYDDMGLGKLQPLDSKILFSHGWGLMGDAKVGDRVIGADGHPTTIVGVYPQGMKEIFKVSFSDGSSTECGDEHLWAVRSAEGTFQVMTLAQIMERQVDGDSYEIPMMAPAAFPVKVGIKDLHATAARLSHDTDFPEDLLWGSIEQRITVLQGVVDTSGYISLKTGLCVRAGTPIFARGVIRLVQSLGGTAQIIDEDVTPSHTVAIALPEGVAPFTDPMRDQMYSKVAEAHRPSRRIVKINAIGIKPAQCIAVSASDHLYVTDDYIVTHNTVQGVAYANARPDLPRTLVISKANMKYGWKTAFERFGVQPRNAFIIEGASATIVDPKTKEERSATPTPEMLVPVGVPITEQTQDMVSLVIINYDILTHHADFIRNTQWDLVIQDEIHSVSNEEAQRTRIIFGDMKDKVKKPIGLRLTKDGVSIGLSGTPHPVVERMWPILSGLRPDVFGTGPYAKRLFIQRYAPPTLFVKEFPNGGKRVLAIPGRPIRQAELNRRLRGSGFMTRRLKADMKDFLPPKTRAAIELPFTLTEEETKELAQLEGQIVEVVAKVAERSAERGALVKNEGRASAIIDVVKGLHPKSPEFHEISRLRSRIGEIKAPYVAEYVMEEMDGEEDLPADIRPKTVIFAHHKAVIGAIRAALETKYPGQVIVYDGSVTSDKKRFDLEKRFQTDDKIRFFVMSLSGASGITLTRANRLYMAEMDWDPTNLPQIEDRIWRMTQELPCFIGYFMVPNSLDVQMGNRLIQRMEDNRLIYDEIDLRPGVQPKKTDSGFTKVKPKVDERQGTLPL